MPFSNELLNNASKLITVQSIDSDFAIAKEYIMKAVKKLAKATKNVVSEKTVDVYIHGSYANATNIFFPSNLEIVVELKIKPFPYTLTNNYFVQHELELTPKKFRDMLFDALHEIIDPNCTDGDKRIIMHRFGKLRHTVEITPCISFEYTEKDGAKFKGVILHDKVQGADIATFPKLHTKNGQTKDIMTEGNFKRIVRLFKTLAAVHSRETETTPVRGYFIECLLFNIPDALYRGSAGPDNDREALQEVFLKVLNYLLHANFTSYVCQNLVWHLFGNTAEFWNAKSAHEFVTNIKTMYKLFPPNRIMLT